MVDVVDVHRSEANSGRSRSHVARKKKRKKKEKTIKGPNVDRLDTRKVRGDFLVRFLTNDWLAP